ncbi:Inhibitor of growth protein [Lachnellula hyalina]|uniref:Inhibitor of growth protein n=1 Tax=Lachnellula hyalina TaxID=1316788 RepID=A0A8H8U0I0_9HELO|nr:Inhibitor of growth protein [Lachnellula hyalina]TVY29320.1 Inhibitor of growth protein [Lachnellula hyalina]
MAMNMATDGSRRRLDSNIMSCRIKLPNDNNARPQYDTEPTDMDVPLQSTSPSSRRNKGKLAEAMQSMAKLNHNMEIDLPTDPDAQATVTDFLDFTEYLPSDMIRSLTLIGNLDQTYTKASAEVHDLTTTYGQLPTLPADSKPDATKLRSEISQNLSEAVVARTASFAEACRMVENAERHYNRIKNIHAKLVSIAETYPPTREPSPVTQKIKSPVVSRPPKITLRVGPSSLDSNVPKVHKHRAPRITVPGEVLAPYELDYESYGSEVSESEEEQFVTPRETPARNLAPAPGKIRLKINKEKKERLPKPPRESRPPGFGTNVHSQVAGISTSNALRLLDPPPENARPGSKDLPWLALSEYELGVLRKKMKKNAVWVPSDTMIKRELKERGRGMEAYLTAKHIAEEKGETITVPEQLMEGAMDNKDAPAAPGTLSVEAANKDLGAEENLVNRGMKLNEAKKAKKLQLEKEREKEMVEGEAAVVEATRRVNASLSKANLENLFTPNDKSGVKEAKPTAKTPTRKPAARKRKRESEVQASVDTDQISGTDTAANPRPLLKRTKTETPVPAPLSIAAKQATPASEKSSIAGESASVTANSVETPTGTESLTVPVPVVSPKKSSTPILPPLSSAKRGTRKDVKKPETPISDRPRRGSKAATPAPAPVQEPLPPKRPTSSRSKAASIEHDVSTATATMDRPRRASTARNTPAPEPRQPSKRTKRPAPGVVTKGSEDSTAVSVGKRSAATRKKAGTKKEKREGSAVQEIFDEIDDEGNIIDPNEPRYCLCNRVSFGTMIGCENPDVSEEFLLSLPSPPEVQLWSTGEDDKKANVHEKCEKEWFHLECVGLSDIPPRTTKWYCPACRVTLGIGEKGEVNARGRKK